MSPLEISYHHLSSVTDIKYVLAIYYQDMFFLDILNLEDRTNWISHLVLHTIQEESRSQNMFNFSVSLCQKNSKWLNINVLCYITSEYA